MSMAKGIIIAVIAVAASGFAAVVAIKLAESGVLDNPTPVAALDGTQASAVRLGPVAFERENGSDMVYVVPVTLVSEGPSRIDGTCIVDGMKASGTFLFPTIKVGETGRGEMFCPPKTAKIVLTVE